MDNAVMGWLHDRIPCLLTTDAEVAAWLDPATPVPAALALLQLPPNDAIAFHPVTTAVGSVKNQDLTLMLPVQLTEAKESPSKKKKAMANVTAASQNMMAGWLKKTKEEQLVKEPVKEEQMSQQVTLKLV